MTLPPITPASAGASVGVRVPEPAVDLAALVQHLAASVLPSTTLDQKFPAINRPFIDWDPSTGVLSLDTEAVLTRLRRTPAALQAMRGFLIDAGVPRTAARAYLGGAIKPGTEAALREATRRLVANIDAEIDAAERKGFAPTLLSTTPAATVLDALGNKIGLDPQKMLQGPTRLCRTRIDAVPETQAQRQDEVARIMDAIEEVDGTRTTLMQNFFASVESLSLAAGYTPNQVTAALQYHKRSAEKMGTQLARLFDFLEDGVLARVRMRVGSHIMEALGAEAERRHQAGVKGDWALLAAYVRRATELLQALSDPQTPAIRINLSAEFGQNASFNLRDEAIKALFVACLPVWPQSKTQMFEEQSPASTPSSGPTITRELTYHFRVNGVVPVTGKPSYITRLERIEKDWLRLRRNPAEPAAPEQRVNRSLAEIVFLWAVIPEDGTVPSDPANLVESARHLAQRLEQGGRPAIEQTLQELRARDDVVRRVTRALTALLREKGTVLTRSRSGRRWDYYVNVLPTIINMQRIGSELDDPLACSTQPAQEQIDFLRNTWITRDQSQADAVLSVRVQVRLMERSLSTIGEPETLMTRRCLPDNLMQVAWRSSALKQQGDARETFWLVSPRIDIIYNPTTVRWPKGKATDPRGLNVLAATRSALAVLVHITLLRLAQRCEAITGRRPALSMLRLQEQGSRAGDLSGDEGVYAAAQAVEIVLARDADLRMQGITFDSQMQNDVYKQRGSFAALFAGFPLQISQPHGERPLVGVVTFAARPCNEHPDHPDAQKCTLVLARTYLASPIEAPFAGYDVRALGSRTELTDPSVALPDMVAEEIERLYALGCRHIILISHRFGQRRVGSAAAHPRLRDQTETLIRLAQSHADLLVYPLVRDVFDATRLRQREKEDAFEILRVSDHLFGAGQILPNEPPLHRRYEPVYSLATLHVVGGRPAIIGKPQSGFCTYFLLHDTGMGPAEMRVQLEGNLLGDGSSVRSSLLAVLRSLHYLEAERATGNYVQPVLDPYGWMTPHTIGRVGDVLALPPSRRGAGSVCVSLVALLDRTSRIAHAFSHPGQSVREVRR